MNKEHGIVHDNVCSFDYLCRYTLDSQQIPFPAGIVLSLCVSLATMVKSTPSEEMLTGMFFLAESGFCTILFCSFI